MRAAKALNENWNPLEVRRKGRKFVSALRAPTAENPLGKLRNGGVGEPAATT
jgi:hypothetical protein